MTEHVERVLPEEACGMIGGKGTRATIIIPITNDLHSNVKFSMNPLEQLSSLMALEKSDIDLLAIYHSHPNGPIFPSESDVTGYGYPDAAVIIWAQEGSWQAKGYFVRNNQVISNVTLNIE